ncbi:arsenate reductase ArsC [Photobacterium sp. SDRW27]|uniref:arsenate reductase/protein-tyrosine-phosphatase family protein n=1 Tax=Photobacterium obscurum TaxID=2829490 RepID=UPI002244B63E|nr:arsenate reductase ArsC [Photobacterium obscurum]MCW8328787.1 arsenate reductase ArsC [Photobacterium obscurum]
MKIMFTCRDNACRSILAEAIAQKCLPERFEVASAGSEPVGELHPYIESYLDDMGLNPDDFHSKSWDELTGFKPDIVISFGESQHSEIDASPNWGAGGIRVNWELYTPIESGMSKDEFEEQYRQVSASLKRRIDKLGAFYFEKMMHDDICHELEKLRKM